MLFTEGVLVAFGYVIVISVLLDIWFKVVFCDEDWDADVAFEVRVACVLLEN